jgi:hypothetical protein
MPVHRTSWAVTTMKTFSWGCFYDQFGSWSRGPLLRCELLLRLDQTWYNYLFWATASARQSSGHDNARGCRGFMSREEHGYLGVTLEVIKHRRLNGNASRSHGTTTGEQHNIMVHRTYPGSGPSWGSNNPTPAFSCILLRCLAKHKEGLQGMSFKNI